MTRKKTRHNAEFKAKVALEASKEIKSLNELATQYSLHPSQISHWKKEFMEGIQGIFALQKKNSDDKKKIDDLYRQLGQLTMENEWLKKKLSQLR